MESTKSQIISILDQLRLRTPQHRARLGTAVNAIDQLIATKCTEANESGYSAGLSGWECTPEEEANESGYSAGWECTPGVDKFVYSRVDKLHIWAVFESERTWGSARVRGIYSTKDAAEKRRTELITKWPYDPQKKQLVAEHSDFAVREYLCGEDISGTEHL
jgi:hypothetical protein